MGTFDVRTQLQALVEFGAIPAGTDVAALADLLDEQFGDEHDMAVTHEQMVERFGETIQAVEMTVKQKL